MIKSRYTFLTTRPDNNRVYLVNYLSGAVDEVEPVELEEFRRRFAADDWSGYHLSEQLLERGYLYRSVAEEDDAIQTKYLEFEDEYQQTSLQLIFVASYACNFDCSYCFQESYRRDNRGQLTPEIIDSFFNYCRANFQEETVAPYITLFGGEPLLKSKSHQELMLYFFRQAAANDYGVAVVTNGYNLSEYIDLFRESKVNIREIQVTLDGPQQLHDSRRQTTSGEPTFTTIVTGINAALADGYRINLRAVIDRENIEGLPELARFCEKEGWLDLASSQFQTTLGRNYELHSDQEGKPLFTRLQMWQEFVRLAEAEPLMRKFHRPYFHGMRTLNDSGELPPPIFDGCPAGKREWAFDYQGGIYGCTAAVGVKKYRLGSFIEDDKRAATEKELDDNEKKELFEWQTRDVLTIPECRNCPGSLTCGGGCGVIAANQTGNVHSPDCRPIAELVGLGAAYYRIDQ